MSWPEIKHFPHGGLGTLIGYEHHRSNEAYLRNWPKEKPKPQGDELTRLRKESYQAALKSEQRNAAQSLTQIFIIILIDLVVFAIHWYMAKRARAEASEV